MNRHHQSKYRSSRRKRSSFSGSNAAPFVKLGACVLLFFAVLVGILYFALPRLMPLIGVSYTAPFMPAPTPKPTPKPTEKPHKLESENLSEHTGEVVITASQYRWFGDPYRFGDSILITAGELVNNASKMTTLYSYDIASAKASKLSLTLSNSHFMYPVMSKNYICYLDANYTGGGTIRAYNRSTNASTVIKTVYAGLPKLFIWENYLVWTERTGSYMDKLFVCDLATSETTTLQMFDNSYYGLSNPFIYDGHIVWADIDTDAGTNTAATSMLCSIDLTTSLVSTQKTGSYIHDPQFNGKYYAWMNANHADNTAICLMEKDGADKKPKIIAEGVTDFGMGNDFVAYCKGEAMYAYVISRDKTYRITAELELAMFLGVSDDTVFWMDVTSRDRDVVKFLDIGKDANG